MTPTVSVSQTVYLTGSSKSRRRLADRNVDPKLGVVQHVSPTPSPLHPNKNFAAGKNKKGNY